MWMTVTNMIWNYDEPLGNKFFMLFPAYKCTQNVTFEEKNILPYINK